MIPVTKIRTMLEQTTQVLDLSRKYVFAAAGVRTPKACMRPDPEPDSNPTLPSRNETHRGCFKSKLNASSTRWGVDSRKPPATHTHTHEHPSTADQA